MTRISKPYLDPRLEWQDLLPISAPASYDSFVRFVFENGTQGDEKLDAALKECKEEVDLTNHCIAYCAQKVPDQYLPNVRGCRRAMCYTIINDAFGCMNNHGFPNPVKCDERCR
ncbi:hypothetical protein Q1695_003865 [Nippostrongylus brasiliensis]|nr:hypothetical protein Q1695_003865 [Nippostrongylus brasiliensis]